MLSKALTYAAVMFFFGTLGYAFVKFQKEGLSSLFWVTISIAMITYASMGVLIIKLKQDQEKNP